MRKILPIIALLIAISSMMWQCRSGADADADIDSTQFRLPDTLRVVTLYSPSSYFIYRENEMGYDYDLVNQFVADKGIALHLEVATNLASAIEMLDSGLVDLIAYEVPVTAEYKEHVLHCGVENITHQVLVQPRRGTDERITDVTQLVGREVYVEKDSKYHARLRNLNDELGGGIDIHPISRDTLIAEDLIAMVSDGEIPLTIVDSDIAGVNRRYYTDLDVSLEVSFPQRASWGVATNRPWLADSINAWMNQEKPHASQIELLRRYFEWSKNEPAISFKVDFSKGHVSPYDHLFKKYAAQINWDWRLIAAQGYTESKFDSTQVSWAGARGVMQLMPGTARAFGLSADRITENDANIQAAVKVIESLDNSLKKFVANPQERSKFVIAAYNSGLAHIIDAIALAKKVGYNPAVWSGNVEQALMLKSNPEYYNDPVCKYGYFGGRQTISYVKHVFSFYDKTCRHIHK